MVKLIRLATENNGIFRSNFQNNIEIEPNSKIALLNTTFQTAFEILNINPNNNEITFNYDTANATNFDETKQMLARSYNNSELDTLIQDLEYFLNSSIKLADLSGSDVRNVGNSAMFNIRTVGGRKRIEYRYAPFLNALYVRQETDEAEANLFDYATGPATSATAIDVVHSDYGGNNNLTTISKLTGAPATDDRTCKMTTLINRMCKGNGLLTIRINNSVTNGSGNQDNGFGIGISHTGDLSSTVPNGQDIPADARDFEIRYNRPAENYQYIQKSIDPLEQDSGIAPVLVTGNLKFQDTVFFRIYDGKIEGGVCQYVGGTTPTKQVFFTEEFTSEKEFYPYLYIRGAKTHITVDMFNFSMDPWINQGFDDNADDDEPQFWWDIIDKDFFGNRYNGYSNGLTLSHASGLLQDILELPSESGWDVVKNARLTLHSDIWRFLGFDEVGSGQISKDITMFSATQAGCWNWYLPNNALNLGLSDNYIVESLSLNLDSFDASKIYYETVPSNNYINNETAKEGRRKNILLTLPVNDNNSNGLVEYETSTPIFIDINNSNLLNQRNLDFQILNKNFQPIDQSGETAILTLLIKGPNE